MPRDLLNHPETAAPLDADGEILMRAADIIYERGWQVGGGSRHGPVCLWHALGYAGNEQDVWCDRKGDWARRLGFDNEVEAWIWNDDQPDAKPVIARLRAAARGEPL